MSNENIKQLNCYGSKTGVKFTESCLKQEKITYTHGKTVNTYIVCELSFSTLTAIILHSKTSCLLQLNEIKMLILISTNILAIVLNLIEEEFCHFLVADWLQCNNFWNEYEFIYKDWWQKKWYFDSWWGSHTRIRTYTFCRKNAFD